MNLQQTHEIRELTTSELDAVFGGVRVADDFGHPSTTSLLVGALVGYAVTWVLGVIDSIFG
jgi:hypothetical protein